MFKKPIKVMHVHVFLHLHKYNYAPLPPSTNVSLHVGKVLHTVAPRYNAVVGDNEMEPRYKRGAL